MDCNRERILIDSTKYFNIYEFADGYIDISLRPDIKNREGIVYDISMEEKREIITEYYNICKANNKKYVIDSFAEISHNSYILYLQDFNIKLSMNEIEFLKMSKFIIDLLIEDNYFKRRDIKKLISISSSLLSINRLDLITYMFHTVIEKYYTDEDVVKFYKVLSKDIKCYSDFFINLLKKELFDNIKSDEEKLKLTLLYGGI